jgi:hypothetical protein
MLVLPNETGGVPGPSELAGANEESVVLGIRNPVPNSISDRPRAPIVAGFQKIAPAESSGAATEAPPIERLIGPTPLIARPNWARAEGPPNAMMPNNTAKPIRKGI